MRGYAPLMGTFPQRGTHALLGTSLILLTSVLLIAYIASYEGTTQSLLEKNYAARMPSERLARLTQLDGEEGAEGEGEAESEAPSVADMHRAQREIRESKEAKQRQSDIDWPNHSPKDHWYYSGRAVHRKVDMTEIRARSPLEDKVGSIPDSISGAAVATNNQLYMPAQPPPEHDIMMDVDLANIENPTRTMVARALEHIQANEIRTEYFHDSLVDNDPHSSHYQQRIHVPSVPGSKNNKNGLLSYNGIGGIFGPGAMFGSSDARPEVPLRAFKTPNGSLKWVDNHVLNTENVLQAGTSFTDKPRFSSVEGYAGNRDIAQAILRISDPKDIRANKFLGYDPANPPAKSDPTLYVHSWAAYTPEGSRRREIAARGQLAYEEWRREHPQQGDSAEHGVPCFNGKVPCKPPGHDPLIKSDPSLQGPAAEDEGSEDVEEEGEAVDAK